MVIADTVLLIIIILLLVFKDKFNFRNNDNRRVILDTCALIDGRILELSKSGLFLMSLLFQSLLFMNCKCLPMVLTQEKELERGMA